MPAHTAQERVHLLVIDENEVFRRGLAGFFQEHAQVPVEAHDIATGEADGLLGDLPPKTAVFCSLSHPQGLQLVCRLVLESPTAQVVAIVDDSGEEVLFEALRHGATACLPREAGQDQWLETFHRTLSAPLWMAHSLLQRPGVARRVLDHFERMATLLQVRPLVADLSPRERQVLHLLSVDTPTEEALAHLALSPGGLWLALESIRGKLVSNTYLEELVKALQHRSSNGR